MLAIVGRAVQAIAMLAVLAVAAPGAIAEPASPQAFVERIYKSYLGKDSKGVPLGTAAEIRRYFAPPLSDAMVKDVAAAAKAQEVPLLDGDPFIDAQDWEISNLQTSVKPTGPKTAVATVTFLNFKERRRVTLDLVNGAAGWRITDIRAPSGSLRALYKLR